jgi:hypothetical protein
MMQAEISRRQYEVGARAERELKLDDFVISVGGRDDDRRQLAKYIPSSPGRRRKYMIEHRSRPSAWNVFDVYVDGKGETLVLLHEGEVDICTRTNTCRRHNTVGRIVHAPCHLVIHRTRLARQPRAATGNCP